MSRFEEIREDLRSKITMPAGRQEDQKNLRSKIDLSSDLSSEARRAKEEDQDGAFLYLPELTDFQKKEIEFHDKIYQDEEELHQLNTVRNKFYHDYFKKWIYKLPKDSVILEVGGGSGFDLIPLLKKGYSVIESDLSAESVKSVKRLVEKAYSQYKNQVIYLAADGQNLPLSDNSVGAVFMAATFHHFEDQQKAFKEFQRVTKKGGLIILAMEPSRFIMWFTKLFRSSRNLRIHKDYSEADESHKGYSKKDLESLIINHQSSILKLKRVWLILGFLHYGLEAIYRLLKLKKRLKVPRFIECLLLFVDEILLKIPIINNLNWHWILIIKKIKI